MTISPSAPPRRRHIHQVLDHFRGNKRRTARALGLSRSTLDRKLSEH